MNFEQNKVYSVELIDFIDGRALPCVEKESLPSNSRR